MPSYLLRQGATLHFRCKVPGDIKGALGCSEIKVSLQTGYRSQAKPRATALAGLCLCAFQSVRGGQGVAVDELRAALHGIVEGAVSIEAGLRMLAESPRVGERELGTALGTAALGGGRGHCVTDPADRAGGGAGVSGAVAAQVA